MNDQDPYSQEIEETYVNIPTANVDDTDPLASDRFGSDVMRLVQELQVGIGTNVFRADKSGIWLGGDTFADGAFSVSMEGNVTIKINDSNANEISFLNDDDVLYGVLQVADVGGNGYLNLGIVDGSNVLVTGLQLNTGQGASAFESAELKASGVSVSLSGNASNAFLSLEGVTHFFEISYNLSTTFEDIVTDETIDMQGGLFMLSELPAPAFTGGTELAAFLRDGAMWYDSTAKTFRGRINGVNKTFTLT